MKTNIIKSVGNTINRIGFKLQKHSPEILVVTGVIGVVVSAVTACKATTKAGAIAEDAKQSLDVIKDASEKGVTNVGESYNAEDARKDTTIIYVQTAVKYVKLYGPSVAMGAASIACILASHKMLKKRNVAIAAAYTALDKSFKEYRGRVVERFGKEVEKELRYNVKAKEVETTVVDEKGKEKKVKEVVTVAEGDWNPSNYSPYARFFDETHRSWMKSPEHSRFWLKALQSQANDKLKAQGHLFLNDVYGMLGYPLTDYGQAVGWIYDLKNPRGDNYVDFGIFEVRRETGGEYNSDYVEGFVLDFNVVGDITGDLATHQYY